MNPHPKSPGAGPVPPTFQRALEHHQRGRLREAGELCRQVLQTAPRHADALHLLGVLALQGGDFEAAAGLIRQAIAVRPADNFYCNLGIALKEQGLLAEATDSYRRALALNAKLPEALCNLGQALLEQGDAEEAAASCRKAIGLRPDFVAAHCNLGNALLAQSRLDDAVACYRQALRLHPGLAVAHSNLGRALTAQGHLDDAIDACQRALQIEPRLAAAYSHLGDALRLSGMESQALACFGHALEVGGPPAELHGRMAQVFRQQGQLAHAIGSLVEAFRHGDSTELREAFVQTVRTAHFQAPQDDVRALLIRALQEAWAEPGELLTPATSLVECHPAVKAGLALARDDTPLDAAMLTAIAGDRLLQILLESDALNSIALERLLTLVRRQMLDEAVSDRAKPEHAPMPHTNFSALIAHQCFINEYVYACSEHEQQQLARLRAELDRRFSAGALPEPHALVAFAAYAPLSGLAGATAWAALAWPDALSRLFTRQVLEPAVEHGLRDAMPRLTAIADTVSLRVQAQYEENPYPRWMRAPPAGMPTTLESLLRRQFPNAPLRPLAQRDALDVLVAGCGTGQHPIRVAQQLKNAQVLAIDLSLASLGYAQRKTLELGLERIEYAQADLLQLRSIGRRFDLIESAGVLHHLADPLAGWKVLMDLLRPGGLMFLGLYSELGRRDVVAARRRIAEQGLAATAADIRRCRQQLMSDALAPQFQELMSSRDFYTTSACRDLLFHVQEHRFSLPQLKGLVDQLGLRFIGFELEAETAAAYARQFPGDAARTNFDHWHDFETARPNTFSRMYQFWLQKPG